MSTIFETHEFNPLQRIRNYAALKWSVGAVCVAPLLSSCGVNLEANTARDQSYYDALEQQFLDGSLLTTSLTDEDGFSIASSNVLGSSHTVSDGAERLSGIFSYIEQQDFDIIGFQELQRNQRARFIELSAGRFDIYPEDADYNDFRSANSIAWDNKLYDRIDVGYIHNLDYLGGTNFDAPWVILKHKPSGHKYLIINVHDPANVNGPEQNDRYANALKYKDYIENMISGGVADGYFIIGDFNSRERLRQPQDDGLNRAQLTYCVLTSSSNIANAYDTVRNKNGQCPTTDATDFGIDHIYHDVATSVASMQKLDGPKKHGLTDHPIVYANIKTPNFTESADDDNTASSEFGSAEVKDIFALQQEDYESLVIQADYDEAA